VPRRTDVFASRLIKSGTDFRDLTSAVLTLTPTPPGSIRRRLISSLRGTHHYVLPTSPTSPDFQALVDSLLSSVSSTLSKPVCFTLTPFDARSELVRTRETGLGNWVADVLLHAYAESGVENKGWVKKEGEKQSEKQGGQGGEDGVVGDTHGKTRSEPMDSGPTAKNRTRPRTRPRSGTGTGADAVIICGGTLRGDSQYGPGKITLGDILGAYDADGCFAVLPRSSPTFPVREPLILRPGFCAEALAWTEGLGLDWVCGMWGFS
jgi:5'-nucleotidase